METKALSQFTLYNVHHECLDVGRRSVAIMPLTHVILEESASLEFSLLGWIFVIFILRQVREFLEHFIKGLALCLLHDSLFNLGRCIIGIDGGIEVFQSFLTTDAIGLVFCVRVGEDNYVVPLEVVDLMLTVGFFLHWGDG